jgi:hypothetical protein
MTSRDLNIIDKELIDIATEIKNATVKNINVLNTIQLYSLKERQ